MIRKTLALAAILAAAPAMASAQSSGMTRVQIYALQQQLKEECGLAHTSGRMDGPTRAAVARCNKKYGTKTAWDLAGAMNLGFDASASSSAGASSSDAMPTTTAPTRVRTRTMSTTTLSPVETRARRNRNGDRGTIAAQTDSIMRADRDAHGHNQGPMTRVRDTAYSAVADSLARATKGLPAGPTKTKKKN